MEKGRPIMKGLPFLRNNIYKDYHLMIRLTIQMLTS